MPGLIANTYYRDLLKSGLDTRHPIHEFTDLGDFFSAKMLEAGLMLPAGVRGGGAAIIGAMERTDLGEELYDALNQRGGVQLFESMQAEIDAGEIERLLHQLNS